MYTILLYEILPKVGYVRANRTVGARLTKQNVTHKTINMTEAAVAADVSDKWKTRQRACGGVPTRSFSSDASHASADVCSSGAAEGHQVENRVHNEQIQNICIKKKKQQITL